MQPYGIYVTASVGQAADQWTIPKERRDRIRRALDKSEPRPQVSAGASLHPAREWLAESLEGGAPVRGVDELPRGGLAAARSLKGVQLVDLHDRINRRLRQLWKEALRNGPWPPKLQTLWPMQYPPFRRGAVLFVGLNPSVDQEFSHLLPVRDVQELDDDNIASNLVRLESRNRGRDGSDEIHPFSRPLLRLTPEGYDWEHIDVFAVRETSQDTLRSALKLHLKPQHWDPFAQQQFDLFRFVVNSLEPVAVVVINALASRILKRQLSLSFVPDMGYYVWVMQKRRIPVFLSGALTGPTPLDRFSRERLRWHIWWVLQAGDRRPLVRRATEPAGWNNTPPEVGVSAPAPSGREGAGRLTC